MSTVIDRPLFLAALRLEARFVRGGARASHLEIIGMGPERASAAIARVLPALAHDRPVVLLGVSGALIPGYRIGEIVVGSSIASAEHARVEFPHAEEVAQLLTSHGLSSRVVALASSRTIVRGPARAAMSSLGEVVDMESAWCVPLLGRGPFIVVRSVVDSPEHELMSPGVLANATRALRALKRVASVLSNWSPSTVVPSPSMEAAES